MNRHHFGLIRDFAVVSVVTALGITFVSPEYKTVEVRRRRL